MTIRHWSVLGLAGIWLLAASPAAARLVTMDAMNNPKDWEVAKDNTAIGNIEPIQGPGGLNALDLRYELIGGSWIAYYRKLPNGTPGLKAILFQYRGQGVNNFEIKVTDASGATFGTHIPQGTNVKDWTKVVVPADSLEYLWGGTTKTLNNDNIRKFEFTVSLNSGGMGRVQVAELQYSTEPMASTLPKESKAAPAPAAAAAPAPAAASAAPVRDTKPWPPASTIVITSEKQWQTYVDQGASLRMSSVEGPQPGQKGVQAIYTWGLREIPGVQQQTGAWLAMVTEVKMDLTEVRGLSFMYRNTGAVTNLEVKLHDQTGCVFGRVIPSGNAMSVWSLMTVPRADFKYLWGGDGSGRFDWGHVKQVEIALSRAGDARDSGTFTFSDIRFESAAMTARPQTPAPEEGRAAAADTRTPAEIAEAAAGQIKVTLDDFTDLNPANRYYVIPRDDSTLALEASRITFASDYSMKLRYILSSNRPNGSWVEAQRRFSPPLDWTGVDAVRLWVRGDGSRNVFRFTVTDGDGNAWVYADEDVLASTEWFLVSMPIEQFKPFKDVYQRVEVTGTLRAHLQSIRSMSIGVASQPRRSSLDRGEIYVETLYLVGRFNAARAVPLSDRPPVGIAVPLKNWNIGGVSNTISETTPKAGNSLTQNLVLKVNGNFEKVSVLGEVRLDAVFGDQYDRIRSKDAAVISPNLNISLLNPIEGINYVMVGNLWFNSSPAIFANDNLYGGWGFKGALLEGFIERFHHRTYYLKHAANTYSLAGHYDYNYGGFNASLIGTYYNQSPFVPEATKLEQDDKSFLLDLSQRVTAPGLPAVVLRAMGGYDWYQQYWDASRQQALDLRKGGEYLKAEVNLTELESLLWPGLSLTALYRYVSPEYKPPFRQHPGYWDIEFGDQKGANFKLYQTLSGAYASVEYDKINRLSDPDEYRERTVASIGYNNWASLDISLSQEFATKIYHYTDLRYLIDGLPATFDDNKYESNTTLYLAYHLGGSFVLSEWMQFKRNRIRTTEERFYETFSTTRLTYYPAINLAVSLENKFSHYGPTSDQPISDPSDPYAQDDYTRIRIDLTF